MKTFFMHIRQGNEFLEDPDGGTFQDLEAARQEALSSVRELVAAIIRAGATIDDQRIEIVGEDGELYGTVRFRDVLDSASPA